MLYLKPPSWKWFKDCGDLKCIWHVIKILYLFVSSFFAVDNFETKNYSQSHVKIATRYYIMASVIYKCNMIS